MICKYCGNNYPDSYFGVALTTTKKIYRRRKCRFCYAITKDKLRKKVRQEIIDYKKQKGCAICAFSDPRALDFHHKNNDKEFSIGNWISKGSRKKVWEEIEKCTILCANCHRIMHSPEA